MRRGVLAVLGIAIGLAATSLLLRGPLGGSPVDQVVQAAEEDPAAADTGSNGSSNDKPKLPPLVVGKDAPLLLEEPAEKKVEPLFGPVADNTACYCCHTNYEEEEFVQYHAVADVGCIECHGQSFAHRNDEDNVTPPDVMFAPEKIAGNCAKCHDTHDAPAAEVITRWRERCPAKTDPKSLLCTDCHGEHRLKFRTVWWDKNTGKLIVRKEGQRIKPREDLTKPPADTPTGDNEFEEMR